MAWLEPANVVHQVCEPLTRTGHDNSTRPHLQSHWTVSPDLRSWQLYLRRDVTWHNGRRFTADDVVWNLKRLLAPETGSSALSLMAGYMLASATADTEPGSALWDATAGEKDDDLCLRLNLKRPQAAAPEHLSPYTTMMHHTVAGRTPGREPCG